MKWWLFSFFCLCFMPFHAQKLLEKRCNVLNFSTKDGLPNNNVNFTFQDKKGFLWIGTWGGLSRFDGYYFYNFYPDPSKKNYFSIGQFTSYLKLTDNTYVLGTLGDGLFLLNCSTNQLDKLPNSPKSVNCIVQSAPGILWIGTLADGFYRYSLLEKKSKHYLFKPLANNFNEDWNNNTVDAIGKHKDFPSKIWLGCRTGLYSFNLKTEKLVHFPNHNTQTVMHEYAVNAIKCFYFDKNGRIWTGNFFGGLAEFDVNKKIWKRYFYNPDNFKQNVLIDNIVLSILPQNENHFLLSTAAGPMEFDKVNHRFLRYQMIYENVELKGDVNSLFHDRDGNIWVSQLYQKGLSLISKSFNSVKIFPLPTQKFAPDYYPSFITDFYFSQKHHSYYVAVSNHDGLIEYNRNFTLKKVFRVPPNWQDKEPYPTSIAEDRKGNIWLSDITGKIMLLNSVSNSIENIDMNEFESCEKLIRGPGEKMYAQTNKGLFCWSGEKWKNVLPHYDVLPKEISTNDLLVVQKNKLYTINLISKEKSFLVELPKFSIENTNYIHEIFKDSKNRVWIPLEYGGVYQYDINKKKLSFFNSQKGLTSNNPRRVSEDPWNRIFLICQGGIFYFNEAFERFVEFHRLVKNTPSEWYESFISFDQSGNLLLSKSNAFGIINQNHGLGYNSKSPFITTLKVNEKRQFSWAKNFIVPQYQNSLEIGLSNFNFSQLNEIIYEYKLHPYNKKWKQLEKGRNSIELNNLNEGKYTLYYRLAASKNVEKFDFQIQSVWYKSRWFYSVLALVLVIGISGFLRFYYQRKTKEKELEQKVAEFKLKALQAQLNPHFLFNCLTSISGLVKLGEYQRAENTLHDFAKLMRKVLLLSDQKSIPLREEIELSKLYLNIERVRKDEIFDYNIQFDESLGDFQVPPMTLQPFLENCVKHAFVEMDSDNKGLISILVAEKSGVLILKIVDNGVGLNPQVAERSPEHLSKGIQLQKERLLAFFKMNKQHVDFHLGNSDLGGVEVRLVIHTKQSD